jgi:hypothetical protein
VVGPLGEFELKGNQAATCGVQCGCRHNRRDLRQADQRNQISDTQRRLEDRRGSHGGICVRLMSAHKRSERNNGSENTKNNKGGLWSVIRATPFEVQRRGQFLEPKCDILFIWGDARFKIACPFVFRRRSKF